MPEKADTTTRGKPLAKTADRKRQPVLDVLRASLRKKQATGHRVGAITEEDKYGEEIE